MSDQTNKYYIILTALGHAMVAESIKSGQDINLKLMAVGDADYTPTSGQTALMSEKARVEITDIIRDEDNPAWLRISAILASDVGGWHIHEVGIFAENGNLFAVGKMDGSYKPVYTDGMVKEVQLDLILEVGGDANINLVIDPYAIIATRKWVIEYIGQWKDLWTDHIENKNNPHETTIPQIPTLEERLKSLLSKDFAQWGDDITINLMRKLRVPIWLEQDTTWYVNGTTGNDANDGSTPEKAFKTIQGALNFVSENFNFGEYTATIKIASGNYNEAVVVPGYTASTGVMEIVGPDDYQSNPAVITPSINFSFGGKWSMRRIRISTAGFSQSGMEQVVLLNVSNGAKLTIEAVTIEFPTKIATRLYAIVADDSGSLIILSGCSVSGAGNRAMTARSGTISLCKNMAINGTYTDEVVCFYECASFSTNPVANGGVNPIINGACTGRRYTVALNATCSISAGGAYFFPGTINGQTGTGGQYS